MSASPRFVAVDLGAESGRVVVGILRDGRVVLKEISRFPNRPVALPDGLHWDIVELYRQTVAAISLAAEEGPVDALGVDTWGVDYGLLDEQGRLLGLPFHYRDQRTQGLWEETSGRMAGVSAYRTTGIRPMPINTVFQLLAEAGSGALRAASRIALIADLLTYWLSGVLVNERTVASTTGLLDARTGLWAMDLVRFLGLPECLFGELVEPGTVLGPLLPSHRRSISSLRETQVVATAGHDTAAAFAGVPADSTDVGVLSSGTWSLLGLEMGQPVLTEAAEAAELSNERGVFGTVRLLRNIMGLWLLQQCRAAWGRRGFVPSYEELTEAAQSASPECPLFDPDDPSLSAPADMPRQIEELIVNSGQPKPADRGVLVRSILTSLACKYRLVLEALEVVTGRQMRRIHVAGGGSRNRLLCQLTADITQREVTAGPAEASALGNVLAQACALGHISGRNEMRELACASVAVEKYFPSGSRYADKLFARFLEVAVRNRRHPDASDGRKTRGYPQ